MERIEYYLDIAVSFSDSNMVQKGLLFWQARSLDIRNKKYASIVPAVLLP